MEDVFGKWYHLIGIGGAGMSGLARILLDMGIQVSGSDLVASPNLSRLREQGARVYVGHAAENLQPGVDHVVVSSAIPSSNVEVLAARRKGLPVISRGDLLAQLMLDFKGIAIVGAHGKTTTSSMISLVLAANGFDPTCIIGGEVNDIGGNARLGRGDYLVAEADESDGSFLKLAPYAAVITNIDNDHLDYYKNTGEIIKAFQKFLHCIKPGGFAVLCTDNRFVRELDAGDVETITYGLEGEPVFKAKGVVQKGFTTEADILENNTLLGRLYLSVPGLHNVQNALAAVAVGRRLGLAFPPIAGALQAFHGARRRFQLLAQNDGIKIIDDYAHHPTEIKALMKASMGLKARRTIAVFQPHRYTRTSLLKEEFGTAFDGSDLVIVTDIYSAGEPPIEGVTSDLIVQSIRRNGQNAVYIKRLDEVVDFLGREMKSGDLILTIGAGNVYTVGQKLAQMLAPHANQ
ncbi:MAG TPA: UDP-N-acetylmuramate--L-alanine ligase [Syntrophomonadaceae bacterium]|nr:UDP-N-acetylmuramate--L-alanine ligase [Syntrophomonadaceae bacterium]